MIRSASSSSSPAPAPARRDGVVGGAISIAVLVGLAILLVAASDDLRSRWWVVAAALAVTVAAELVVERRSPAAAHAVVTASGPIHERAPILVAEAADGAEDAAARGAREHRQAALAVSVEAWSFPKSSSSDAECEDAFAVDGRHGVIAVADGASSAPMAREWAQTLTSSYVASPPPHRLDAARSWVDRASAAWQDVALASAGSAGSWWAGDLQSRGSHATFLGVDVHPGSGAAAGRWDALAVGDSCLVHLRHHDGRWVRACSFPIDAPEAFASHPDLVATRQPEGPEPLTRIRTASGELDRDDLLLVMTDALAQWALSCEHLMPASWDELASCSQEELGSLVARARHDGSMVDDDVTLARIRIPS
ncbi:MAG: hypothetical protein JWM47_2111 [Acidimicrobiales bacterium]|nr:hypothetical protein [Acidimicrobiales bacterium]